MATSFPYRVLDLTDEKGFLCGKLLADLGAEVIKVERPGGEPSRNIPPFYQDIPHPEKSLYWWAYNLNKKGITLDTETADGKAIFQKLVRGSDFVIESFPVGYLNSLGLGYSTLKDWKPSLILTSSITPDHLLIILNYGRDIPANSEFSPIKLLHLPKNGISISATTAPISMIYSAPPKPAAKALQSG